MAGVLVRSPSSKTVPTPEMHSWKHQMARGQASHGKSEPEKSRKSLRRSRPAGASMQSGSAIRYPAEPNSSLRCTNFYPSFAASTHVQFRNVVSTVLMRDSSWVGIGVGGFVAFAAATAVFLAAGAGHGTYVPAVVLFPAAMLTTLFTNTISPVAIALALVQFPAYGFVLGKTAAKRRLRIVWPLALLHIVLVITALAALRGGAFL